MKFSQVACIIIAGFSYPIIGNAAPQAPTKVLLAQAQSEKIAQIEAGTLKEARASWWGFDKNDATDALQNAINSGVPKLIIDNTGSDWIISKPIQLASNQEIVFEDGVVVQAKKGAFKGKKDHLFRADKAQNFSLIGQGKVLFRMHRADYHNPQLYEKAEWRHGIALYDCSNVVIRNLTVEETGGDGLYLGASREGFNKNILVEDCTFDKNYRQGISVISAEDLTIRNCKLTNTGIDKMGTAPRAGIDFEPNGPKQRLINCVVENCIISGNQGGGIDNMGSLELPISITIKDSKIFGNKGSGIFSTVGQKASSKVLVENCTFDHQPVTIRNALDGKADYSFKNCTFDYSKAKPSATNTPIKVTDRVQLQNGIIGGISFDNSVIKTSGKTQPIRISFYSNSTRLAANGVSGNLYEENIATGEKTKVDLAKITQKIHANLDALYQQKGATASLDKLHPPLTKENISTKNNISTRNKFVFLQYAEKGEEVTVNTSVKKIYDRDIEIELHNPQGKVIQKYEVPFSEGEKRVEYPITFTAEETGLYQLVRTQNFTAQFRISSNRPGNGFLVDAKAGMAMFPSRSKLYFEIPAGVEKFMIGVRPETTASAKIIDSNGKEITDYGKFDIPQPVSVTRTDASHSEIWEIDLSGAVTLEFYDPLIPIFNTNPNHLLRAN